MGINEQGFVRHCTQTYDNGDTYLRNFVCNDKVLLNYMKRSEGGNEVTGITYSGGNITHAEMAAADDRTATYAVDIKYTSDEMNAPIENKGCIMLFDETFSIDMDEMKYAYYAGLLGKATKDLPIECISGDLDSDVFEWALDGNGYPVRCFTGYGSETTFDW